MSALYYDRKGQPLEMMAWAEKFEDRDYQTVAQHWVRGWMVSTVWLGINHNFSLSGPPVIFETMIFSPGDVSLPAGADEYMERYSTEEAAQAGHDRAIAWLGEKLGPDVLADLTGPLVPGSSDEQWDGTIDGLA